MAQDSAREVGSGTQHVLPEVVVRGNLDFARLLRIVKDDTTFYKAFKNLRILSYGFYTDIKMLDKNGNPKATYSAKAKQIRRNGCRTMEVEEENATGDFFGPQKQYNYFTANFYDALFHTHGQVCGETNLILGAKPVVSGKTGLEKHKEQLKMLFFNPGKKVKGVPFIGNKLDLFDERAYRCYDHDISIEEHGKNLCYVLRIRPKDSADVNEDMVVDYMTTWFDTKTMEVLARDYALSYKAGVYDFKVSFEVEMGRFNGMLVPVLMRYKGDWDILFQKRERGAFTATLFGFEKEVGP